MTHRVSAIDDHRRIVPGRGSGPAADSSSVGGRVSARPVGRRAAAHPSTRTAPSAGRPAPGRVRTVTGRVAAAPGRALAVHR